GDLRGSRRGRWHRGARDQRRTRALEATEPWSGHPGVPRPRALRYLVAMKKTPHKLVLCRETLRALAIMDLVRAVGGLASADTRCLAAATTDTHDAACPTAVAA